MKKKTAQFIAKAKDAIEAAELLLKADKVDSAAGRAYYAMFYVAEALLCENDLQFSKHSAVHSAFGEHFAKPGKLDSKFHRYLLEAFESRLEADYDVEIVLDAEAVSELLRHAKEFLAAATDYLKVQASA